MFMIRSLSFMMKGELSVIEVTEHATGEYKNVVLERRAFAVPCATPPSTPSGLQTRDEEDFKEKTSEQQPLVRKAFVGTGPCFWNGSCAEFRRRLQQVDMEQVLDGVGR